MSINKATRAHALNQQPRVLWLTGLPCAGKSTIASLLEKKLEALGRYTYLLDGDNIRLGLSKNLDFTPADRVENIRRISEVAKLMVDAGLVAIVAIISPFRLERAKARALMESGEFVEIFVDAPIDVCEARDVKGHYAKARRGELPHFTASTPPMSPRRIRSCTSIR